MKHASPELIQRLVKSAQLASLTGEKLSEAFVTSAKWHEFKDQMVKQVAAEKELERAANPICVFDFFRKPFRSSMGHQLNDELWQ